MVLTEPRHRALHSQFPHLASKFVRGTLPRPVLDFATARNSLSGAITVPPPVGGPVQPDAGTLLLMQRATNGFSVPAYQEALAMGYASWLDGQLDYENVDDSAVEQALLAYPTLTMTNKELYQNYEDDAAQVVYELQEAVLLRGIYSRRQLYERMVEFWTDHLNIFQLDDFCLWFKTRDDVRVIRQHALGNFPDMLKTSAKSAAMLWYLDNYSNIAGAVQENYARELMELHTLGVDGPYTEEDVVEVARCFTGWTFHGVYTNGPFGKFVYVDSLHDQGAKQVLGVNIPANGGMTDAETVLDLLAMHPKTAEHISTKMARWLLSYEPPQSLVERLVTIYLGTGGSIQPMVREILKAPTVLGVPAAERRKLKRPYHLLTAVMRAAQISSSNLLALTSELVGLGQVPYWHAAPNGYQDSLDVWGKGLLPRWVWSSRLFGKDVPGNLPEIATLQALLSTAPPGSTTAQAINWVMTGGTANPADVYEVQAFFDSQTTNMNVVLREAFALMASSPSYQYY